ERFELLFQILEIREYAHRLSEHAAAAHLQTVLGKISYPDTFRRGKRTVIEWLYTRDYLQQSGLARAVSADQSSSLARRYEPVQVFKQQFVSEPLAGSGESQHL